MIEVMMRNGRRRRCRKGRRIERLNVASIR